MQTAFIEIRLASVHDSEDPAVGVASTIIPPTLGKKANPSSLEKHPPPSFKATFDHGHPQNCILARECGRRVCQHRVYTS